MAFTSLSDDFTDDCWSLSDQAHRLHVDGLVWSNRKLLDLRLPKDDLRRFAKHPEAAPELVACGWWSDEGDAYVIQHHGVYQRTKETVLNRQKVNVENGSKGGRPRGKGGGSRREQAEDLRRQETESVSESVSESLTHDETHRDRKGKERSSLETEPNREGSNVDDDTADRSWLVGESA
jgi:hypothetical protein